MPKSSSDSSARRKKRSLSEPFVRKPRILRTALIDAEFIPVAGPGMRNYYPIEIFETKPGDDLLFLSNSEGKLPDILVKKIRYIPRYKMLTFVCENIGVFSARIVDDYSYILVLGKQKIPFYITEENTSSCNCIERYFVDSILFNFSQEYSYS